MRARCCSRGFTPDARCWRLLTSPEVIPAGPVGSLRIPERLASAPFQRARLFLSQHSPARCHDAAPLAHNSTRAAAMDAIRSALSIVPSGTAATIIVGHALLTKVMICVETNQ